MILANVFGSVTVLVNEIIADLKTAYPNVTIQYCDWETHANINELPDADLVGPTAIAVTEHTGGLVEVNFSIAASTYQDDTNLFRLRDYISRIFERMRPEKKMTYFDAESASVKSFMVFTDGTMIAPMSRAEIRAFQYVQATALLEPTGSYQ